MSVVGYLWSQLKGLVTPSQHIFKDLVEQSKSTRKSIISPLQWVIAMFLTSGVGSLYADIPRWVPITLLSVAVAFALVLVAVYFYCLKNNPSYLRSEQFELTKMAIEKHIVGTSATGLIESPENLSDAKEQHNDAGLTKQLE